MQFTAPSGRVYTWTKKEAPTEQDIREIVKFEANQPTPEKGLIQRAKDAFIESQKTDEQRDRETFARAEEMLMGERVFAEKEPRPEDITTVGGAASAMAQKVGPTIVRVGGPIAAVASLPTGVGTLPALAYLGGAGLLSENVARAIEGRQPTTALEGAQAAVTSAALTPMRVPVGVGRAIVGGAIEGAGFASQAAVQEGRSPLDIEPLDLAVSIPIAIGGRSLENLVLSRSAQEAAAVIDAGLTESERLAKKFAEAKNELVAADLAQALKAGQIGEGESIILAQGATPQGRMAQLDVRLGVGEGAASERARLAAMEAAPLAGVEAQMAKPLPKMSAQASRMADQYGFIDPRILAPMARAGIGYAAGNIQGDTTEEDIGYGLTYAITGAVMSPSLAKKAGDALLKNTSKGRTWVPEATLGPLMDPIRAAGRDAEALLVNPQRAYINLKRALDSFGTAPARQAANIAVYEYLTGARSAGTLPAELANAAMDARTAIDDLTDELIGRGLVTGELRDTLVNNKGAYLRRAYKVFIDPDWKPDRAVFDKWVNAHVADALANPKNTKTKPELEAYFTGVAQDLIDRNAGNADDFILSGAFRRGNEIFKQRENLSSVTRELLGEINDPLLLFSDTAPRMAAAAANFQMRKNVVDMGTKLGLFSTTPSSIPGRSVLMAPENAARNPMAGIYSTPEIREAFNSISSNDIGNGLKWLATASSVVKAPKTLGSMKGYASNVWGGVMDTFGQGHGSQFLNLENWRDAITNTAIGLKLLNARGNVNKGKALDLYRSMVKEGLINKSLSGEDFVRTLEQSVFSKGAGKVRNVVDNLSRIYMAPESITKMFNFKGELDTVTKAFPGLSADEAFRVAAARTRATSQDYEYLPRFVRKMSQLGGLDPFISYTADRFRVVYNTYKIGLEDLASKNPVLRKAGAKRIASMTTVLGIAGLIGNNVHLSSDEEAALRRRLPSRDSDGFLRISQRQPDGSFTYTNLNYNFPQTIVMEAAAAAMRGDNPTESAKKFLSVIGNQLFGANLVLGPLVDVYKNKTDTGKQVFSESQPVPERVRDASLYLAKEWFMPLAINEIGKAYRATKEVANEAGQKNTLADLALSNFAGIRKYRIDLPVRFKVEAAQIGKNLSQDQIAYSSAKRNLVLEEEKELAYRDFEKKRYYNWNKVSKMVDDARTLGYSDDEIIEMMKGGVNSRLLKGAIDKIYIPSNKTDIPSPSEQFEEWEDKGIKTIQQRRAAILEIAKTDRARARPLLDHLKEAYIQQRLGITDSDKLLLSYAANDGSRANYISLQMRNIAKNSGFVAAADYMRQLQRKRIVTPEVSIQIRKSFSDNPDMLRAIISPGK